MLVASVVALPAGLRQLIELVTLHYVLLEEQLLALAGLFLRRTVHAGLIFRTGQRELNLSEGQVLNGFDVHDKLLVLLGCVLIYLEKV